MSDIEKAEAALVRKMRSKKTPPTTLSKRQLKKLPGYHKGDDAAGENTETTLPRKPRLIKT